MTIDFNHHLKFMDMALEEAKKAYAQDEVPIGALIVSDKNEILASSYNLKEATNDPCGHAEILAIQRAAKKINDWRLVGSKLYVTLEPCSMCLGAMIHARISQLYFGAYDKKAGAISLGYKLFSDKRLNHQFEVHGGLRHYETSKLLTDFFKQKRALHK